MKIPGQTTANVQPAGAAAADPQAPIIRDWDYGVGLPSALFIGESGTGKTDAIGRIIDAGVNVCAVDVENKMHVLARRKPCVVNICEPVNGKLPDVMKRWDRLQRFADALAAGKYREHNKRPIQVVAIDGLMEVGDIIKGAMKRTFTAQKTLQMWGAIGDKTVEFVKTLRDAAGMAAERAGVPPIAVIATCGEELVETDDGAGTRIIRYVPFLPGKAAAKALPYQFELVWRFSAGVGDGEQHEFRIATQKGATYFAKSPAGVFDDVVVSGQGVRDGQGQPDAGAMFRALIENENSPYFAGGA